jgi:hypothetical protein
MNIIIFFLTRITMHAVGTAEGAEGEHSPSGMHPVAVLLLCERRCRVSRLGCGMCVWEVGAGADPARASDAAKDSEKSVP